MVVKHTDIPHDIGKICSSPMVERVHLGCPIDSIGHEGAWTIFTSYSSNRTLLPEERGIFGQTLAA